MEIRLLTKNKNISVGYAIIIVEIYLNRSDGYLVDTQKIRARNH